MIAYFGWKYRWASALLIYWLALNVFTMSQQMWMYRKYGLIGPKRVVLEPPAETPAIAGGGKNGAGRQPQATGKNGSTSGRSQRRSKR